MADKILAILRSLLSLTMVGLLIWAIYKVIVITVDSLSAMKSDLAVAIIAASASVTVSIVSLVISKFLESRAAVTQEHRAKKTPIYEEFIATLFQVLFAEKLGEKRMSEPDLIKFFASYTEKLMVWGSDDVIKAWRALRMAALTVEGTELLLLYENLLLEIRKDLGHKNQGLKQGTLLGLFVNDIDKHL